MAKTPVVGIFGGYFYLNLSHMRLLGLRLGMSASRTSTPRCSARTRTLRPTSRIRTTSTRSCSAQGPAPTIGEILGSTSYPMIDEDRRRTSALRANRPDLAVADRRRARRRAPARSRPELDNGFAVHDYSSLASTIGPAILGGHRAIRRQARPRSST